MPECGQEDCTARGTIWFRLRRPTRTRLIVEFDLRAGPPDRPTGTGWRWVCKPHMEGAIVVIDDVVRGAVDA